MRWYKWQSRMNARAEVHAIFGSRCARCGNDDWRVLELDHVAGGGNADRVSGRIDKAYSRPMIEFARANRQLFQLLCANCHRIKTWEDREAERAAFPEIRPMAPEQRKQVQRERARDSALARAAARTPQQRSAIAKKGAATRMAAKTHCKHGHEFTPENTSIGSRGGRICLTCKRERARAARAEASRSHQLASVTLTPTCTAPSK